MAVSVNRHGLKMGTCFPAVWVLWDALKDDHKDAKREAGKEAARWAKKLGYKSEYVGEVMDTYKHPSVNCLFYYRFRDAEGKQVTPPESTWWPEPAADDEN